jgi:hypothetical protein
MNLMRQVFLTILAACLLAPTLLHADDADDEEMVREVGAVLAWRLGPEAIEEKCRGDDPGGSEIRNNALKAWLDKNAALIQEVDARVAEVVPLAYPPSKKTADPVQAVGAQVKAMFLDSIFEGKSPEESAAICKQLADPANPRWHNPGRPNVDMALATLYDWKVRHAAK